MILPRFSSLSAKNRAMVAIAVLMDGKEAISYLRADSLLIDALSKAANELSDLEPELRMPLAGTILREALLELERN